VESEKKLDVVKRGIGHLGYFSFIRDAPTGAGFVPAKTQEESTSEPFFASFGGSKVSTVGSS
jgi:hypothetical protein